jgi:hypothetical protein
MLIARLITIIGIIFVFWINRRSLLRGVCSVSAVIVAYFLAHRLFVLLSKGVSIYDLKLLVASLFIVPILLFLMTHLLCWLAAHNYSKLRSQRRH